jgi:PilZ domain
MTNPDPEELLTLALGVLPALPCKLDVLSEDGGSFALSISHTEHGLMHAFGPRDRIRKDLHLLARITDESRGGYEVEFEVHESFFHSGAETLAHVAVSGVRRRKMRRTAARVQTAEQATATALFCRRYPRDTELEVRLADVSATGVAFTCATPLDDGDLFLVRTVLNAEPLQLEARVIRCYPAPYDRFRVGCEITDLDERARGIITGLVQENPGGSIDQRNPDARELRQAVRSQQAGLGSRLRDPE